MRKVGYEMKCVQPGDWEMFHILYRGVFNDRKIKCSQVNDRFLLKRKYCMSNLIFSDPTLLSDIPT